MAPSKKKATVNRARKKGPSTSITENVPTVKKTRKTVVIDSEEQNLVEAEHPTSISSEQNNIDRMDKQNNSVDMGESWRDALKGEFEESYFKELMAFISAERERTTIYPPVDEVYSWTKFHPIVDTKTVILGQDPYHGPNQAHGLSFSVKTGVPLPPSLKNIYKELESDINGFVKPEHGHLIGWALQGVLLLNACLTVVANKPNSHKSKGWEKLTDTVIKWLNLNLNGIVFILWGVPAQKKGRDIDSSRHLVLAGKHPSPLSAPYGFFGCKHFSKANDYLREKGKKEIDWSYLPESI